MIFINESKYFIGILEEALVDHFTHDTQGFFFESTFLLESLDIFKEFFW